MNLFPFVIFSHLFVELLLPLPGFLCLPESRTMSDNCHWGTVSVLLGTSLLQLLWAPGVLVQLLVTDCPVSSPSLDTFFKAIVGGGIDNRLWFSGSFEDKERLHMASGIKEQDWRGHRFLSHLGADPSPNPANVLPQLHLPVDLYICLTRMQGPCLRVRQWLTVILC